MDLLPGSPIGQTQQKAGEQETQLQPIKVSPGQRAGGKGGEWAWKGYGRCPAHLRGLGLRGKCIRELGKEERRVRFAPVLAFFQKAALWVRGLVFCISCAISIWSSRMWNPSWVRGWNLQGRAGLSYKLWPDCASIPLGILKPCYEWTSPPFIYLSVAVFFWGGVVVEGFQDLYSHVSIFLFT